MFEWVNIASKVLGVLTGITALFVAFASLTSTSRLRKREAFYREAANGETDERAAILLSLRREATGAIIARQAAPVYEILIPVVVYVWWIFTVFISSRQLAQDIVAGKPLDRFLEGNLLAPIEAYVFGLFFVIPSAFALAEAMIARRRLAEQYMSGLTSLTYASAWRHFFGATRRPRDKKAEADARSELPTRKRKKLGTAIVAFLGALETKLVVFAVGSGLLASLTAIYTVGADAAKSMAPFPAIFLLVGSLGTLAGLSLLTNGLIQRVGTDWRHPFKPSISPGAANEPQPESPSTGASSPT